MKITLKILKYNMKHKNIEIEFPYYFKHIDSSEAVEYYYKCLSKETYIELSKFTDNNFILFSKKSNSLSFDKLLALLGDSFYINQMQLQKIEISNFIESDEYEFTNILTEMIKKVESL